MDSVFLSDIELYFSEQVFDNRIEIGGEEYKHIVNVMRHRVNDLLHVTDGKGRIYIVRIKEINKTSVILEIIDKIEYNNDLGNVTFCIPLLKSADRFEFAIEKCIELGITNFIFFASDFSVKKKVNISRIEKIALSAMKQSLRAWKPKLSFIENINHLISPETEIFIFDQHAEIKFNSEFVKTNFSLTKNYRFIFGPEGGFSPKEYSVLKPYPKLHLTSNRLRSETAIISSAIILTSLKN